MARLFLYAVVFLLSVLSSDQVISATTEPTVTTTSPMLAATLAISSPATRPPVTAVDVSSSTTLSPSAESTIGPVPAPKEAEIARPHDIIHVYGDVEFNKNVYITVRVHDSECFSSRTESSYVLYLGTLSFENDFLNWYAIQSKDRNRYDKDNGISHFEIVLHSNSLPSDPEKCFAEGMESCVPRADVVYIQYHNEPEDAWSISLIEVEVQFRLWPGGENWHVFKYEHSVLQPCESWMDEVALYQVGPRIGLFLKLDDVPAPGEWVRDWI